MLFRSIIGAGHAGEGILRDILRNKQLGYKPVGILDDQRNKLGQEIHRVRVLGVTRQLSEFVEKLAVDLVIIATPSTTSKTMRRLVNYCHQAKVEYRTLPGLRDIASGNVSVNDLREVQIEDLLGRDQVQTDRNNITRTLLHKKVLVSGGGGSIGSELCRQIAQNNPAQIIVIENCEFNLYKIQMELNKAFPSIAIIGRLIDIVDRETLETEIGRASCRERV